MKIVFYAAMALGLTACATNGSGGSGTNVLTALSTGSSSDSPSQGGRVGAAMDVFKAATVSDDELKSTALQFRAYEDRTVTVAPAGNRYAKRLARLTSKHTREDGMSLNFKVYMSNTINANATPDGSIRVYSGLMDLMTDAELMGVIGHEIGHVKLGHAMSGMRSAYLASAGRKAAASASGAVGRLADSELGALGEKMFNSQFSQGQETDSDDYGLVFVKKYGYGTKGMETAFRKLAAQGGKSGALDQMMSSHPDPGKRADRMRDKAAAM